MRTPRISILLPLQDERDAGVDCARAWIDDQTANGEDYEIVAIAIGDDPQLERSVRPLLRDQDRWIEAPGIDEYEAFNRGAEQAHGEFVFLTEAHCIPDRDCIATMLEELERTGAPGVRAQSVPENRGRFGALEMEAVASALRDEEEDPEHWRRVLIHGTAIRRDIYLGVGGMPTRFGDFAPWALSMELRDGQRPVLGPRTRMTHVYDGDFGKIEAFLRSFGSGEVRYRSEHPGEATDRRFPWSPEWEDQLEHTRAGAIRALRAGLALRRGTPRLLARHLAVVVVGPRASVTLTRARAGVARHRARMVRDPARRRRHFHSYWSLTARRGRLEALARGAAVPPELRACSNLDLTAPLSGQVAGFHPPEHPDDERPFRWTAPLAILRANVAGSGRMRARLELRPSPWAEDAWIRVAVDGRVAPATVTPEAIEFELESGVRWIAVGSKTTRPGRRSGDRRALGLPVRSLSFRPAGRPPPTMRAVGR